jgi:mannose-6-phosphate isomerase-like protein (cupin superfamily)
VGLRDQRELHVTIDFREYVLEPGDSISLDSTTPHRLANVGDTPVHAIWFVVGRDGRDVEHGEGPVGRDT